MKNLLILIILSSAIATSNAQMNDIYSAIRSGNAESLSKYFDNMLEVCIADDQQLYTKKEAIAKVRQFFNSHRPSSFKEIHVGSSKGKDSKFTIGELTTNNGNFRVYIFVNQSAKGTVIKEIRFDKP